MKILKRSLCQSRNRSLEERRVLDMRSTQHTHTLWRKTITPTTIEGQKRGCDCDMVTLKLDDVRHHRKQSIEALDLDAEKTSVMTQERWTKSPDEVVNPLLNDRALRTIDMYNPSQNRRTLSQFQNYEEDGPG